MFALIVLDEVLLFDEIYNYGLYKLDEVNLNGYKVLDDYKLVLNHYQINYYNDIFKVEDYSSFLFRVCLNYLKDFPY